MLTLIPALGARTTGLYDMAKNNKDRHASHRVASFLAGMTG